MTLIARLAQFSNHDFTSVKAFKSYEWMQRALQADQHSQKIKNQLITELERLVPQLETPQSGQAIATKRKLHKGDHLSEKIIKDLKALTSCGLNGLLVQELLATENDRTKFSDLYHTTYSQELTQGFEGLFNVAKADRFSESLLLWSPTIWRRWQSVLKNREDNSKSARKKKAKVAFNIFIYLRNAVMVPTPRASWTSVISGQWGTETKLNLSEDFVAKNFVRPNNRHLSLFADALSITDNSIIKVNPTLFFSGQTAFYWQPQSAGGFSYNSLACPAPLKEAIFSLMSGSQTRQQALKLLDTKTASLGPSSVILDQLLQAEILVKDKATRYGVKDAIEDLSHRFGHTEELPPEWQTLRSEFENLSEGSASKNFADRWPRYKKIRQIFAERIDPQLAERPFRLDSGGSDSTLSLSHEVQSQLQQATTDYAKIYRLFAGAKTPVAHLKERFLDLYPSDQPIPLLQVENELSKNRSTPTAQAKFLGKRTFNTPQSSFGNEFYTRLTERIATTEDDRPIEIADLLAAADEKDGLPLPTELEVVFQTWSEKEKQKFSLDMVNHQVGRLVWRTAPLFSEAVQETLAREISQKSPDEVIASVVHVTGGDNDDLVYEAQFSDYEIELYGAKSALPDERVLRVGDLFLKYNSQTDEMELRHPHIDKKIQPRFYGTLTTASDWLTSVLDILSSQKVVNIVGHARQLFEFHQNREFTPRIECGSLVLSRATWKLPAEEIKIPGTKELAPQKVLNADEYAHLLKLKSSKNLPTEGFIMSASAQKPVYINFEIPLSLTSLFLAAQKSNGTVFFQELLPSPEQTGFKNPQGHYQQCEFWSKVTLQGKSE